MQIILTEVGYLLKSNLAMHTAKSMASKKSFEEVIHFRNVSNQTRNAQPFSQIHLSLCICKMTEFVVISIIIIKIVLQGNMQ